MKYLIFGDVHGNLPALELMLKNEAGNYDMLVSHGDVVNYGPWSNECVDLLSEFNNCVMLKGNHEEYFITGKYDGTHPVAQAFFRFNIDKFDRRANIAEYGVDLNIGSYTVKHTVDDKYIFADTDVIINRNFIIGHSHQQYNRIINGFNLINTGSVGQNRKYINIINYIIFDTSTQAVSLKQLIYDQMLIINEFKKRHYPEICINYYTGKEVYNI